MLGMPIPILPEHIWSKVSPKTAANSYPNKPPIVGTGPFQVVEWKRGEYVRAVANKDYWRGAPKVDEVVWSLYKNQDTHGRRPQVGRHPGGLGHPAGAVRAAGRRRRTWRPSAACSTASTTWASTATRARPRSGNPVLKDAAFRRALNWADRPAEGRRHRLLRARRAGDDDHPRRLLQAAAGLPLAAGRGRGLHVRPGEGRAPSSTPPATRTPTATASARTRPASRSSCASTRAPSRPPTSASASSSPAGSRRSA